jgi:hypothetical protein
VLPYIPIDTTRAIYTKSSANEKNHDARYAMKTEKITDLLHTYVNNLSSVYREKNFIFNL